MQENDDQFSGNELDESSKSVDDKSESISGEDKFSGDEVDELGDDTNESISEEENSQGIWAQYSGKKRLLSLIAMGLCLVIGIGFFYLKEKTFDTPQEEETAQVQRLKIPSDQLLLFHLFVIPLKQKKGLTYISLSISFNVPNKELRREIKAKKQQLRGIMYDLLREEINKIREIPPLKKIKGFLIRRVNMVLSAGKVNEVYITKFLAV